MKVPAGRVKVGEGATELPKDLWPVQLGGAEVQAFKGLGLRLRVSRFRDNRL